MKETQEEINMNRKDGIYPYPLDDCGYMCQYVEPYGFVPEVGCPVHDRSRG